MPANHTTPPDPVASGELARRLRARTRRANLLRRRVAALALTLTVSSWGAVYILGGLGATNAGASGPAVLVAGAGSARGTTGSTTAATTTRTSGTAAATASATSNAANKSATVATNAAKSATVATVKTTTSATATSATTAATPSAVTTRQS